jgi:hypothetical protein
MIKCPICFDEYKQFQSKCQTCDFDLSIIDICFECGNYLDSDQKTCEVCDSSEVIIIHRQQG